MRADVVIGADGAESLVRRQLRVPRPRPGTVALAIRGYGTELPHHASRLVATSGGGVSLATVLAVAAGQAGEDLTRLAGGWRRWAEADDGWLSVLHGAPLHVPRVPTGQSRPHLTQAAQRESRPNDHEDHGNDGMRRSDEENDVGRRRPAKRHRTE